MSRGRGVYWPPSGRWLAVAAWMVVIAALSALPVSGMPRVALPGGADKWAHAAFYAPLAVLAAGAWRASGASTAGAAVRSVALALAYGAWVEWLQFHVQRDPSLADWAADGVGAALGALAWSGWNRLRQRETRPR